MRADEDLQSVLDKMFASEKNFSFEVVRRWQARFPHFSREIAGAVAEWREFEFFALEDAEDEEEEESSLSPVAKTAMEKALARFRGQSNEAITGLRSAAEKQGVKREDLLNTLGVSETLMRKIERRNLSEIPRSIEKKLAEVLRVPTESLRAFFALPALLPSAARYKSKNAPRAQPKQTFAEAVRNDPELTDEQKRELLKAE